MVVWASEQSGNDEEKEESEKNITSRMK